MGRPSLGPKKAVLVLFQAELIARIRRLGPNVKLADFVRRATEKEVISIEKQLNIQPVRKEEP